MSLQKSHLLKSAEQSLRKVPILQPADALLLYFPSIIQKKPKGFKINKPQFSFNTNTTSFSQNQDLSYNVELHF